MRFLLCEPADFSESALQTLYQAGHEVVAFDPGTLDFGEELKKAEGLIVRLGIRFTAEVLAEAPRLQVILTPTTGLDHIDLEAARERGIEVLCLRELPGLDEVTSTPEHAFALLLALVRNIPAAAASVLRGEWNRDAFVGRELKGKRVGIIGCGRTGSRFGDYCEAFGMNISYVDPVVRHSVWKRIEDVRTLAMESDILSLHVHLAETTRYMLDRNFFNACGRKPYLINTSRGGLVDEEALLEALASGMLSGYAADVVENEPERGRTWASPLLEYARSHDNVLLTPHIAGATQDAMRHTENMIVKAFLKWHRRGQEGKNA
jgi:D-3-phosphoglycerate dehydrogenase